MLLAIDSGNSNVSFGVFKGGSLSCRWEMETAKVKSAKQVSRFIREKLAEKGCGLRLSDCVIANVVPRIGGILALGVSQCCGAEPLLVSQELNTGLQIRYRGKSKLGADRIAAAAACRRMYGDSNTIIVDAGTAVTFGLVRGKVFEGGVIAPGPWISARALMEKTSLPDIEIVSPGRVLCRDTEGSMRAGIIYGFSALVDGIVARIKGEVQGNARVVATGGWSKVLKKYSETVDILEPNLVLKGLKTIADLNPGRLETCRNGANQP